MIHLDYRDTRPIYEQVRDGLRRLLLTGILRPGDKLPSVRSLAVDLAINPNTIQRAYGELEAEGYIVSVAGKGTFVEKMQRPNEAHRAEVEEKLIPLRDELRAMGMTAEEWAALWEGGRN